MCQHPFFSQASGSRWTKVGVLSVFPLGDKGLLARTTGNGISIDRTLVDHDCECKARMSFGLSHHQFRGLVDAIVRAVPVDNHSINSPADHVCDLPVDLFCVRGIVTDIHVVRTSEPEQEMGVHLGSRARVEQTMNVDLTHIACSGVPIALGQKAVGCTCVVCRLCGQCGCGYNGICCLTYTCPRQEQY